MHGLSNLLIFFKVTVLDRPEPPRNIHGSEFAGEALTLNWSAPFEDGGAPITNYVIERFVNMLSK